MSAPQQVGDFIFPWPFGQTDTCIFFPSSLVTKSFSKAVSHLAQKAFTAIPHLAHS